jgi:biopolymer transport protein ExbD
MVPLIDVMLVLLIIFMVTAPLLTHQVKLDLPRAAAQVDTRRSEAVRLDIDREGGLHWNGRALADAAALEEQLITAARQAPRPALMLSADRQTPYEAVAQTLAAAARHGLVQIGFVTDPRAAVTTPATTPATPAAPAAPRATPG